ncbi:O-antigen ligase family protein [uncultured Sphingomonas sp.]|uniref:O-antigen ligase family protein n=1 Tax=uncultured Sphingomonas sp. TaxID=158754 RepID=UPI0035CBC7B4
MLRYIGLVVALVSIPLFYEWMRGTPAQRRAGWFAVGALPFVMSVFHLSVAVIPWAMWPGYVKGVIVTLLDTLALAIILTDQEKTGKTPLLWAYLLFMGGTAASLLFARPAEASVFFDWQLACCILVFMAVSKLAVRREGVRAVVGGLAAASCVEGCYSLVQRAHGVGQATGTMVHQNLLGLCMHFALFLSLAALLAGDRRPLIKAGIAGALVAVALTGSRATTALAGSGVLMLLLLSVVRRPTAAKMRIVAVGLGAMLIAAPVGYLTLEHRFNGGPILTSDDERAAFERAARAMWSDHPMGVGANQFVVRANADGYYDRAGVSWVSTSRGANVHNTYLLIGAETGYLGLGTFLILLLSAIGSAFRLAWAKPRDFDGEMALGAGVALVVVGLHCFYEWVFVTGTPQYLFAITLGLISALSKRRAREDRERRRRRQALPREASEEVRPALAQPVPA